MRALFVALGAGVGAPSRYLLDKYIKRIHRSLLPIETLAINTIGSFVLGLMINSHGNSLLVIGTGFAGAFTTWSTFAVETHHLIEDGHHRKAAIYLSLTVVLGVAAAAVGVRTVS